jgi:protein-disulfide isomerase
VRYGASPLKKGAESAMKFNRNYMGLAAVAVLVCSWPGNAQVKPDDGRVPATAASKPNTAEIERIVHDYLLEHPELLVESLQRFQQRYKAEEAQHKQEAIEKLQKELLEDAASPTLPLGEKEANTISIVAFLDYQCGYCKHSEETISKLAGMPGVQVIVKEFPILGPDSNRAAKAALAASKQNAYQQFHEQLMKSTGPLTPTSIEEIAAALNLDVKRLQSDMESPEIAAAIERNQQLAEKLGVQSTPTFVVGKELVAGALSEEGFRPLIESARHQQRLASAKQPAENR